ncbi:MAG: flagellar hook assembly protein FlgD [Spirochaetes bacterium]|nr:flagellar hook assembly protein FlgD [Spirochaetota bacterium]
MNINTMMTDHERFMTEMQVNNFNRALADGNQRVNRNQLGKEDFLKILITQLTHQDPTNPMEDREFIAQMAQFSMLEQMTNMSRDFNRLHNVIASSQAINLIGKTVQVSDGDRVVIGRVEEVLGFEHPQLLVNGRYYDISRVERIRQD